MHDQRGRLQNQNGNFTKISKNAWPKWSSAKSKRKFYQNHPTMTEIMTRMSKNHESVEKLSNSARGGACPLYRYLIGKRLRSGRADTYPPGFSFPGPVLPIPPRDGGGGASGDDDGDGDDTMALPGDPVQPSCAGTSVNLFGYPPLSDHKPRISW